MRFAERLRKRTRNLRTKFWPWLRRASGFGWGVAGVLAMFVLGWITSERSSQAVRQAGLYLQLAAVLILVWRLGVLQDRLGSRAWWYKPIQWLQEFPFRIPEPVVVQPETASSETRAFDARIRTGVPDEMEKRVERLEREADRLWESLDKVDEKFRKRVRGLESELEEQKNERRKQIAKLHDTLEEVSLGDLKWEGVALGWLFLGPLFQAEPEPITKIHSFVF